MRVGVRVNVGVSVGVGVGVGVGTTEGDNILYGLILLKTTEEGPLDKDPNVQDSSAYIIGKSNNLIFK